MKGVCGSLHCDDLWWIRQQLKEAELIEPECVSFSTPAEAEPRHIQQIIKTLSIIFSLLNVQQVSATIAVYFCWFHSGHLLDVSQ